MKKRVYLLLIGLGAIMLLPLLAFAEDQGGLEGLLIQKGVITESEAEGIEKSKQPSWMDRIRISGDLRLRHESFFKDPDDDRHRERFRLRIKTDFRVGDFEVGVRLASGTGEQTSTNQSFDSLFAQKPLWIDRAYVSWKGSNTPWLELSGGRMPNPFYRAYTSDLVWDSDVNPEGIAEEFAFEFGGGMEWFVKAAQFVLDEDSGDNNDQWLFGQQVGVTIKPMQHTRTVLALAYYDFSNTSEGTLNGNTQDGNTRLAGVLVNDYNVIDISGTVSSQAGPLPVSIMGDYIKNLADPVTLTGQDSGDTGYQAGVILGKAKARHTWELAYFYKYLETDATLADISDSDFGDGGTDRKGHIVWAAYQLADPLQMKVKFFSTEKESNAVQDDIDRLQVDLVWKF